ncbi:hypothetical protein GGQ02_000789, partial [Salinibacter ruber]|uniref:BREX-1 system adenine-specific DNA-methyltransferase PglX n=1 Tax=Salinibacter ruber TaxID=146919 RepID=UPI002169511B
KRKDEVNDSGEKIGADELPAVTQLFTEHYMVQFLLDNTLGAWWTARHPDADLDLDFEYLRFVEDEETGEEVPAAGSFDGWPDTAAELTVMDPCMGSGHFLVAALPMLARMRMYEEGLSAEAAVDRVIAENLHGLEIDERCTQIAAFALAMAAWTFNGASDYRELPEMNLACSGLAPEGDLEDWEMLAGDDERLQNGMRRLYEIFQDAPTLGSLIDPGAPENRLDTATFEELEPLLREVLSQEKELEETERGVVAYGVAQAADMLSEQYHLVTTNVPYLGRSKQGQKIIEFSDTRYPEAAQGLDTTFFSRISDMCLSEGCSALVTQQNWLYLSGYRDFRDRLLSNFSLEAIARLGTGAFATISGENVNVACTIVSKSRPPDGHRFPSLDVTSRSDVSSKRRTLFSGEINRLSQNNQLKNPDHRISTDEIENLPRLNEFATSLVGVQTGDLNRFARKYWEGLTTHEQWERLQRPPKDDAGLTDVIQWENGSGQLIEFVKRKLESQHVGAWIRGSEAWGQEGVAIARTSSLRTVPYYGDIFDENIAVILADERKHLPAILEFCRSDHFENEVRKIDQSLKVTNKTLAKVPFDLDHWQQVAEEKYPDGLPAPYSDDPTQWIFHGHPKPSERPLQVAVARLLGYCWPAERDEDMGLSEEAQEWVERCGELDHHVDDDGIVCIPPVQGERAAADRLRDLLADAYGDDWGEGVLQNLLDEWGYRSGGLEGWLDGATARQKGKFAQQHNKLFGHRPFIWHVSDEHEDGFSALVNYHQLDRANLERLTYTYLGDWINQQESAMERGDEGAEARLLAAQDLQEELKKIIEGEPPYDIFVRWKEAHEQPIGWTPDLNDGVLLNIKPFIEAGILRDEPTVRYTKDRGKNPEGAPWGPKRYNRYEDVPDEHKLKDEDGNVIEHLTNEVKRRVREEVKS